MRPPILIALLALALTGLVIVSAARRQPETFPVVLSADTSEPTSVPTVFSADTTEPTSVPAEDGRMALPADYRDSFALYAAVDRPDSTTRRIYINPMAVDALRTGMTLPEGTQLVVEAYTAARDDEGHLLRDADGHLIPGDLKPELHMAELRSDWQLDNTAASATLGDLNFASFESSGARTDEVLSECFSCHDSAGFNRSFVFTRAQLQRYVNSGETQYLYCDLPGRVPC